MTYIFGKFLISGKELLAMPPISIDKRNSDKYIVYDKKKMRLDNIAGQIYEDDSLWKIILWANPEYFDEYEIEDGTVIRVPFPKDAVIQEVTEKIIITKNLG